MSSFALSAGITVLICTYNGAKLLPETLKHLAAQEVPAGIDWEIVLVSNASNDNTMSLASSLWTKLGSNVPLRVLDEPKPGKPFAIERGFAEARYSYICIVDDDNWLAPNYLALACQIMDEHPQIGALGGAIDAVCEITPPAWFAKYAGHYAVGKQGERSGDLTLTERFICGAGCVVRKNAWEKVQRAGFKSLLVKYPGVRGSGEDVEMCYALILAGYAIWYDERLHFRHFISANRLTWNYLHSLYKSNSGSDVDLRPYRYYLEHNQPVGSMVWLRDAIYSSQNMLKTAWQEIKRGQFSGAVEGNSEALAADYSRWVAKYYLRKQLKGDTSFEQIAAFKIRLQSLPADYQG